MRYSYTIVFGHDVMVSFGNGRRFHLFFRSDKLYVFNSWKQHDPAVFESVTGSFGVMFGCNVIEVEWRERGIIIVHSNIRMQCYGVDQNDEFIKNPPTDEEKGAQLDMQDRWERYTMVGS